MSDVIPNSEHRREMLNTMYLRNLSRISKGIAEFQSRQRDIPSVQERTLWDWVVALCRRVLGR